MLPFLMIGLLILIFGRGSWWSIFVFLLVVLIGYLRVKANSKFYIIGINANNDGLIDIEYYEFSTLKKVSLPADSVKVSTRNLNVRTVKQVLVIEFGSTELLQPATFDWTSAEISEVADVLGK